MSTSFSASDGRRPHVVVVGAGFAGLNAAQQLRGEPVEVTLIDRNNFHTFQPLLYQVASCGLASEEVIHPVRDLFHDSNVGFCLGTVCDVDWQTKDVVLVGGRRVPYDYLVLALGTSSAFFGIDGAKEHSFPLKSVYQAMHLRAHLLRQFELADSEGGAAPDGRLTFVVIGGGPTGVEMAGILTELFSHVFAKDFPHIDASRIRVVQVEQMDALLDAYHEELQAHAREALEQRGVEVRLGEAVTRVTEKSVELESGEVIPAYTCIWGAGVQAHPLAAQLGLEQKAGGRLAVDDALSVPGRPDVFVAGDFAAATKDGDLLPQLAPVAIQEGEYVAAEIIRRVRGEAAKPFVYKHKGKMATIGRHQAVAELPKGLRFSGWFAWVLWLGVHLLQLVGFRNKLHVLVNWTWNYFTYDRGPRLLVEPAPPDAEPRPAGEVDPIPADVAP